MVSQELTSKLTEVANIQHKVEKAEANVRQAEVCFYNGIAP